METIVSDDRYFATDGQQLEYGGLTVRLSDIADVAANIQDVRIFAFDLIIDSSFRIPSGNILICARRIRTAGNIPSISVSGNPGGEAPVKPPAAAPGNRGQDGAPSASGKDGGRIFIVCGESAPLVLDAGGGRGQDGQSGQDGGIGLAGDAGRNVENKDPVHARGGPGRDGQPGGLASKPGAGGAGGRIFYKFMKEDSADITFVTEGGDAGFPGSHGAPGTGGPGGAGGAVLSCEYLDRPHHFPDRPKSDFTPFRAKSCYKTGNGAEGPRGNDAAARAEPVPTAESGAPGTKNELSALENSEFGISWRFIRFCLLQAEADAIRGNPEIAAEKLGWLLEASEYFAAGNSTAANAIAVQVRTALTQLLLQQTPNVRGQSSTPQLALSIYEHAIDEALTIYLRLTPVLAELKHDSRDQATRQRAFDRIRGEIATLRMSHEQAKQKLDQRRSQFDRELADLDRDLVELWARVMAADRAFRDEVARMAACRNYTRTVAAVASVVVAVSSGGAGALTAYAGLMKLWRDLGHNEKDEKDFPDWVKRKLGSSERRIKLMKEVKGGASDVADAVKKFEDLMGIKEIEPPSDSVKFWMSREDFAKMMEPYKELAKGKELIAIMDEFMALRDERNDMLIAFDSMVSEIEELASQIDLARAMTKEYVEESAAILLSDAQRLYEDAQWIIYAFRNRLLRLLNEAERAFSYWSLQPYRFSFQTAEPFELSAAVLTFKERIRDQLNRAGPPTPVPTPMLPPVSIPLSTSVNASALKALFDGKEVTISTVRHADEYAPIGLYDIRADHIEIIVRTSSSQRLEIPAVVAHRGDSVIRDSNGSLSYFRHERRLAPTLLRVIGPHDKVDISSFSVRNLNPRPDPSDTTRFVGVSPFASWSLRLRGSAKIDLKKVISLELLFGGHCFLGMDADLVDHSISSAFLTASQSSDFYAPFFTFRGEDPSLLSSLVQP